MSLHTSVRPEFDAWRWNQYWVELESVVEFKRQVYYQALTELARLLNRESQEINNYGKYDCSYNKERGLAATISTKQAK